MKASSRRLMVFQEKHGIRIFRANTNELAGLVALKVLRERDEQRRFDPPEEPPKPLELVLTDDQIAKLPEHRQRGIPNVQRNYERELHNYNREAKAYERLRRAIDENHGGLALQVLGERLNYEYEYWSFEELEEA